MMLLTIRSIVLAAILVCSARFAVAGDPVAGDFEAQYRLQAGDVLTISVWREPELQSEAIVRPDGGVSFPLVGDVPAAGRTVAELRGLITAGLLEYVPDAVVTVALRQIGGNRFYVVGKVNRPGEFALTKPVDVMQALSLAGGATPYAAVDDIRILRRDADGQHSLRFRYADVQKGRNLQQNVLLQSGDTVVVP